MKSFLILIFLSISLFACIGDLYHIDKNDVNLKNLSDKGYIEFIEHKSDKYKNREEIYPAYTEAKVIKDIYCINSKSFFGNVFKKTSTDYAFTLKIDEDIALISINEHCFENKEKANNFMFKSKLVAYTIIIFSICIFLFLLKKAKEYGERNI